MSDVINYTCMRCGHADTVDMDELHGMPLKNEAGDIVESNPPVEKTGVLAVECSSCHGPTLITFEDDDE